jgi:two-component system sensor histidine kinase GlrK
MSLKKLLSLKSLIGMGLVLSITPLIAAVGFATYGLEQTTTLTRSLNAKVFEQTKNINLVLQKASDVERKARLFILLSDPALRQPYERQSYETIRTSFKQSLDDLLAQHVDSEIALLANELAEKENLIYQQIVAVETDSGFELPIDEAFQGLRESSNNLAREFEHHVDREFNHLNIKSKALEDWLFVKTVALLSTSVLLVLALLMIISRSIRQLDLAIRRLACGEFSEPIIINGSSDLRVLGERLDWLRKHAQEQASLMQHFTVNVAGQIEAPVDGIRTSAEMLSLRVDDVQQSIVQSIATNADKIEYVRRELVRFAEISTATSRMAQKEFVDFSELIESVIDVFAPRLQSKSVSVKTQLKSIQFHGFHNQLRSIIESLLSDALEHSPEHGEIAISLRKSGEAIELLIEDEGPALPPEQRSRLFEPFLCFMRAEKGCGLGLAIVKHYVANHCGEVEFAPPKQAHGACRRLLFPLSTLD